MLIFLVQVLCKGQIVYPDESKSPQELSTELLDLSQQSTLLVMGTVVRKPDPWWANVLKLVPGQVWNVWDAIIQMILEHGKTKPAPAIEPERVEVIEQ